MSVQNITYIDIVPADCFGKEGTTLQRPSPMIMSPFHAPEALTSCWTNRRNFT